MTRAEKAERIQKILEEQKTLIADGDVATVHTGTPEDLDRRIRFLDEKIRKLSYEKDDLERRAGAMVDLDEAQVLRDKAAALTTEIDSLRVEREQLMARKPKPKP